MGQGVFKAAFPPGREAEEGAKGLPHGLDGPIAFGFLQEDGLLGVGRVRGIEGA